MKLRKRVAYPLSITQAAEVIGKHPDSLRHYERLGIVQPIRFGAHRVRLYLEEDLKAIRAHLAQRGK